jgi:predicted nucleic acid-binding protein
MSRLVVDASVAISWFVPEALSEAAQRVLQPGIQLFAPDLLYAEFSNIVWKKQHRGELNPAEASGVIRDFLRVPIASTASRVLAPDAHALAAALDHSAYDCFYLALAVRLGGQMVTADRALEARIAPHPQLRPHLWLLRVP